MWALGRPHNYQYLQKLRFMSHSREVMRRQFAWYSSERLADAGSVGVSFIEESAKAGLHYVDFDGRISAPAGSAEIAIPLTLLARVNEAANTSLRVELYDAQGMDLPDNRSFGVNIEDSGAKAPTPNLVLTPSLNSCAYSSSRRRRASDALF